MKRGFEASDLMENCIEARPSELLCACCMHGGAECTAENPEKVAALLKRIREDGNVHIVLKSAFDDCGARTELYEKTTPLQRKRDLDIMREMGAIPESVRTARFWQELLKEYIPHNEHICAPFETESEHWYNCSQANSECYENGVKTLCVNRDKTEKACVKESSCKALMASDHLTVRAHHFMCMICFLGGNNPNEPLVEDNLYELWQKILENPEIPVTVIEGPGDCVICPPCHAFNTESRLCIYPCSLRDRKKDIEVFAKLNMIPGDTIPAREMLWRIYKNIKRVDGICRFEERRVYEWKNCRPLTDESFVRGMRTVVKELHFEE